MENYCYCTDSNNTLLFQKYIYSGWFQTYLVVCVLLSFRNYDITFCKEGKGLPQQAEVAQGVPGRLRSRIFLTFGITRVSLRHRPPSPQEKSLILIFRG